MINRCTARKGYVSANAEAEVVVEVGEKDRKETGNTKALVRAPVLAPKNWKYAAKPIFPDALCKENPAKPGSQYSRRRGSGEESFLDIATVCD